jgi:hypothetical protein
MTRKSLLTIPFALLVFAGGYWSGMSQTKTRVFELRTYTTNEGKLPDLQKRFRDHTMDIFKRHGITNIGYFTPEEKPNTLIYIIAHESRERRTGTISATIRSGRKSPPLPKRTARLSPMWSACLWILPITRP